MTMFVDEVTIKVEAGAGGDGCTSFRREKYVPMGGPNGGNGGHGANVIFRTDEGLKTLIDLKMMKHIKGDKGVNGKGSDRHGADAKDVVIKIPCGTTITNVETGDVLADLVHNNEEFVVAHGGRGGMGNHAFATHENTAPEFSELGEPGEKLIIKCELKVLADVGLVGMPSVGKSTLINSISNANAKVGAYHFTTLNPNLGFVRLKDGRSFIMADLPGLIEGASEGIGLGDKFLKHAMRTKVIAHVIDMGAEEGRNPIDDYNKMVNELSKYDKKLVEKPHIIIATKMDLDDAEDNLRAFKKEFPNECIYPVIAPLEEGLDDLIIKLQDMVDELEEVRLYQEDEIKESHVLYKFKNEEPFTITKEDDMWVLRGKEIERLFYMTRFSEPEGVERFARKLKGMGVEKKLEEIGAARGDDVRIVDYVFEFKN
ncbi:MAG: GTPase ObgE [Bacilli bacterium]|nr:GTPase ObgE [Bacilli bacterium]